jgi:hypothetical protein
MLCFSTPACRHVVKCLEGPCYANITTPDLVYWAIWGLYGPAAVEVLYALESDYDKLWMSRPTAEVAFGYIDPVLAGLKQNGGRFPGVVGNMTSAAAAHNQTGKWTQKTGRFNWNNAREFVQWNGMSSITCCEEGPCGSPSTAGQNGVPAWLSDEANMVQGTYGQQFAPGSRIDPKDGVEVWVDTLFRAAHLENKDGATLEWKGITVHPFTIPMSLLQNATENPANAAYRMDGPSGVFNISLCSAKLPVLVSKPNFLDADPSYLEGVVGMSPNRLLHDTSLNVEIKSGVVCNTFERLQVNVVIETVATWPFPSFPNLKRVVLPVLWVEKTYNITDQQADDLRAGLQKAAAAVRGSQIASIIGASLGTILFLGFVVRALRIPARARICCGTPADADQDAGLSSFASTSRVPLNATGAAVSPDYDASIHLADD